MRNLLLLAFLVGCGDDVASDTPDAKAERPAPQGAHGGVPGPSGAPPNIPAGPAVARIPTVAPLPPTGPTAALPSARPNFLVIAPDTLRGDRLDATRNGAPVMPNVQALASRGVTFTAALSQSGWTLPALASLVTGRWPLAGTPAASGLQGTIRPDLPTLPERLTAAGYDTAVFWGEGINEAAPEYSRGFAHVGRDVSAGYTAGLADWLDDDRGDKPFFALVHNVDLQFLLAPAPGDPLLATPSPMAQRGIGRIFESLVPAHGVERAGSSVAAGYDAVVTRYDAAIGEMTANLARIGHADDTVVVVISNHGLELGERGNWFHGTVADTALHVPFVVVDPASPRAGTEVGTIVQTVDFAATVLARAGLPVGADLAGQSVLPLLGVGPGAYEERDVYSFCSTSLASVRTRTHKLVRMRDARTPDASPRNQLVDLASDPAERQEVHGEPPPVARELAQRLDAWLAARTAESDAAPAGENAALKKELQENGYWGVATGAAQGK